MRIPENITDLTRRLTGTRALYCLLLLLLACFQLPYFQSQFVPRHDSVYGAHLFHTFYSHFFFHHDLVLWLPYDSFGLPTNHDQLIGMTPFSYLVMLTGVLLRVTDALLLFKVSIFLEQVFYFSGVFFLARRLFDNRLVVFIMSLAAISMGDLYTQVYFDFRMFYLFPWALLLCLRFFETRRSRYLWLAGLVALANDMGNPLYFIALWFYVLFVFVVLLWCGQRRAWRWLWPREKTDWICLSVFILTAGAFYWQLHALMGFIDLAPRGPQGRTGLNQFLIWGGVDGLAKYLNEVLHGRPSMNYIGLLPWVFVIWSVIWVRSFLFKVFAGTGLALLWLSFGGVFAVIVYHFPVLAYYRHIGLTDAFVSLMALFCAGFGMLDFCRLSSAQRWRRLGLSLAVLVFLIDALQVSGRWFTDLVFMSDPGQALWKGMKEDGVFLRSAVYVMALGLAGVGYGWRRLRPARPGKKTLDLLTVVLFSAFVFDIGHFQMETYRHAKRIPPEVQSLLEVYEVNPLRYQPVRLPKPEEGRAKAAYDLLNRAREGTVYTTTYNFLQFDPCHSEFDTLMSPMGFQRLLKTRQRIDPDLLRTLGCGTPKLRLTQDVRLVPDQKTAAEVLTAAGQIMSPTVIIAGSGAPDWIRSAGRKPLRDSDITVTAFQANRLTARLDLKGGPAWLIYADAFHPGWRATLDGRPVTVFQSSLAFKAVPVPQGSHTLTLKFHNGPAGWTAWYFVAFGLGMSVFFLVMVLRLLAGAPAVSSPAALEPKLLP